MRNFIALEEKGSVREFIANDLSNAGLRIDTNKHRNNLVNQPSPHITNHPKQQQQHGSRVFNIPLHQMDAISIKIDNLDLTVPILLRWCFDCIRRSIKHEGLFRKSGGSQRIKELMARIEDGPLTPSLAPSNTVFDICSLFKEFLRRLSYPLITYPLQDLLLDCFSMRSLSSDKKVDIYMNILLLLPDEHLHTLIYILRFLHEITLNERDNKMNAKNLAICVGPGIMRTAVEGKANIMTEQCATSVSDIVEVLIINAMKLGYVADSVYERSQMLLEMRQKEAAQNTDESFAIENGVEHGIGGGKIIDPANAKKRRSGSVKEFLVHMTNRFRRRSGSNNDSRDQTHVYLDQSGKLSSSHTREHRYHYQQNSISGHCLSSSSSSTTTTKRKSSDDPNGGNSKRGKTKTTQEKSSLPDTNRFTSPITAFRRKKKTPGSSNDPGFPFKIEHSHLPQLLHFTDEVPLRFTNAIANTASSVSSSSSSSSTTTLSGSMTTLAASIANNGSIVLGALQPSAMIPSETQPSLLTNTVAPAASSINKSLDAKKLSLLDSWKWPKSSRKAERKPLLAIHAPMLLTSTMGSSSLAQSPPSPIKPTSGSNQSSSQQMGGSSHLMHSSFGVPRRHSDDVVNTSLSTTAYRPRRSISSSGGQQQTRHVVCMLNNYSHSLPSNQQQNTSDDDEQDQQTRNTQSMPSNLNLTQGSYDDEEEEEISNELNLAVVVGHEDIQSLREQGTQEHGSLDVAFIDETDLERQKLLSEDEQRDQSNAMDIASNDNETLSQTIVGNVEQQSIEMQDICQTNDLDEILKRNENRCIRLTDSDDEEHVNFSLSMNRTTPPTLKKAEVKSTTPKMPVRLSSSISNLISTSSLTSICKERSLSCSLSQATNELFHSKTLGENDENIGILNGGRESILQLKGELAGRVLRQVRVFEQRSSENTQNRSMTSDVLLQQRMADKYNLTMKPASPILSTLSSLTIMNTPEQNLVEEALKRGNKIVPSSHGTGEVTRSVKRLQNTPMRRWKERAREFERRHQLTPPYRLLNRKRK